LDEHAFAFFNELRRKHFPPERNYLQAHLTLFHHLPAEEPLIIDTIQQVVSQHTTLPLAVTSTAFIGNGVAYKIESKELLELHSSLQSAWKAWLIPQDKQRLWPHVTVQNKVPAATARQLYEQLTKAFIPFTAYGTGLNLWVYRGGPWEALDYYPLQSQAGF
jgi:2'-5' RNA ligase